MDFTVDPELREIYDTVLRFSRAQLSAVSEHGPLDAAEFRRRWKLCGEQGILGVTVPSAWGGSGLPALAGAMTMQALGRGTPDTGFAFSVAAHVFACAMPIVEFGTDAQRREWLPRLASGALVAAHAITEPSAGSDVHAQETIATQTADGYVLRGAKCFTTNAPVADVLLVHARTGARRAALGLSAFLVDARQRGVHVGSPYEKVGLRGSPTSEVFFDGCTVPSGRRLGEEGAGSALFAASMRWERSCLFGIYVGVMERQLEATLEFSRARKQFGAPIGSFQAVSHRIVDMRIRLESARLLLHRAAWAVEHEPGDAIAQSVAKLVISEAAVQSGLDALQIHGGVGVLAGEAERQLRDALPSRIFSGTSEIQRNNIARALGLGDALQSRGR